MSKWQLSPRLSVMDRYLSTELIIPFLFGMGLFTSLGLAIGVLFDLMRKVTESGLSIEVAIQILILKMPEYIVLALPMSILLATLMAYSRLKSDSELIAMQSSGISIYRIVLPCIIFSLLLTALTFLGDDLVASAANYQASMTINRALTGVEPSLEHRNIIYSEYRKVKRQDATQWSVLTRLFYAKEFDGQQMKGLTVLDRSPKGIERVIISETAIWNPNKQIWDFFNGSIYLVEPDGNYQNIVRFKHQQLELSRAPLDLATKSGDYDTMNIFQAQDYLKVVRLSGDQKQVRKLKVYIQEKMAFPFVCLVFGLVGAAVGIRPQNTGKATSFGICVVLIFGYYLLSFISNSMGVWGVLSPFMAAWLPNFLGLGAGGFLLLKLSR
jgi:lipopolysaccharide export system permease protein